MKLFNPKAIIHVERRYSVNADSEASSQLTFLQEELAKTGEKSSAVVKE